MSKARVAKSIVISYNASEVKPVGGFRLFYRPETTGNTVTLASPSIPIGYSGRANEIVNDTDLFTLTVDLTGLLPLIEVPDGDASRDLYLAIAPVDGTGNIGDLTVPVTVEVLAPVFLDTFTFVEYPVSLGPELLTADGTFVSDADWTVGSEWAVAGNVATFNGDGSQSSLSSLLNDPLIVGDVVRIQFEVISSLNNPNFYIWPLAPESRKVNVSATGVKTVDITITDTAFTTLDFVGINSGGTVVIDNVSIKRIL